MGKLSNRVVTVEALLESFGRDIIEVLKGLQESSDYGSNPEATRATIAQYAKNWIGNLYVEARRVDVHPIERTVTVDAGDIADNLIDWLQTATYDLSQSLRYTHHSKTPDEVYEDVDSVEQLLGDRVCDTVGKLNRIAICNALIQQGHDAVRNAASRVLKRQRVEFEELNAVIDDIIERSDDAVCMDAGYDGGAFSGSVHARKREVAIKAKCEQYGWSVDDFLCARMTNEASDLQRRNNS